MACNDEMGKREGGLDGYRHYHTSEGIISCNSMLHAEGEVAVCDVLAVEIVQGRGADAFIHLFKRSDELANEFRAQTLLKTASFMIPFILAGLNWMSDERCRQLPGAAAFWNNTASGMASASSRHLATMSSSKTFLFPIRFVGQATHSPRQVSQTACVRPRTSPSTHFT